MFDLSISEIAIIVIIAVVVIGPKELPRALATAGRWMAKARGVMGNFRTGFDAMVREAELQEMEKKWAADNERIMLEHPNMPDDEPVMLPLDSSPVTGAENKSGESGTIDSSNGETGNGETGNSEAELPYEDVASEKPAKEPGT